MSLKRTPAVSYLDMRDICNLLSVSWRPSEHVFFSNCIMKRETMQYVFEKRENFFPEMDLWLSQESDPASFSK